TPMYKAIIAAKASTTRALALSAFFSRAYASTWTIARTLAKCGNPCAYEKFVPTARSLGDISIPISPFLGQVNFSKGQTGVNFEQMWRYDAAVKKTVKVGPLLNVE